MFDAQFTSRFSKRLGISVSVVAASMFAFATLNAQDRNPSPPYLVAGSNHVLINVAWDEAAIRKALPPGIEPAKGTTGEINIYQAPKGYGITPYQSAYFWVDIEGFDSPEGTKGRWMLAGVYGPQPKTPAALQASGFPVRLGISRVEPTADGKRAIGTVNGQDFITAEIKSAPGVCDSAAGLLNYVTRLPETGQIAVTKIPFVGDVCKAEPVSAKLSAPSGDPFSAFPIAKVLGAAELRNGTFTIIAPQPVKE